MFLQKARYYSSVSVLYVLTLLFALYLLNPYVFTARSKKVEAWSYIPSQQPVVSEAPISQPMVSGKPTRLIIPAIAKDLPVLEGAYNPKSQTWTLGAKTAHFALPSMFANNIRGKTLIYGHYNPDVFYRLKNLQPGAIAEVQTDNGHTFTYSLEYSEELKPDDVSVFQYQGAPTLALQTCSGSFYEFRQIFHFRLQKVDGQDV